MATNPFFNNFENAAEQNLYEDLVVEALRIYAHDMLYLPRTGKAKDDILNEYPVSHFNLALDIEMYIKNYDSFEGDGQLLAKFGLEIRDQMTLIMSHRSFNEFVKPATEKTRPWEGDCIYIPMTKCMYQIKYVDTSANFFTLGKLNTWEITCELLENSNEIFNTGRPEIDGKYKPSENIIKDEEYDINDFDITAKNKEIQTESELIIDWNEMNPWSSEE